MPLSVVEIDGAGMRMLAVLISKTCTNDKDVDIAICIEVIERHAVCEVGELLAGVHEKAGAVVKPYRRVIHSPFAQI